MMPLPGDDADDDADDADIGVHVDGAGARDADDADIGVHVDGAGARDADDGLPFSLFWLGCLLYQ